MNEHRSSLRADLDLSDEDVRNTAILLLAADAALCDGMTPEDAVAFVRRQEEVLDSDPLWANGKHHGDCTKQPVTCTRCQFEDAEQEARERYES